MNDTSNTQNASRDMRTYDLVTGEELLIVYFPKVDAMTINGYSITRSDMYEDSLGKAVFYRTPSDKPFTVSTESLSALFF